MIIMQIEQNYKGYSIDLDKDSGFFRAYKDGHEVFRENSLNDVKIKIDADEKKAVRQSCIVYTGYGNSRNIRDGTITSIIETDRGYGKGYDVWVSWKDGKYNSRMKTGFSDVLTITDSNKQLIEEIKELNAQREKLEVQVTNLEKKLKHFGPQDFGYGKKEDKV